MPHCGAIQLSTNLDVSLNVPSNCPKCFREGTIQLENVSGESTVMVRCYFCRTTLRTYEAELVVENK